MVQYSILIADGDPDYIQYLSGTLRANGFQCSGTSSGANALRLYRSEAPDLVVADLDLGEMDGLTLLAELRRFNPNAKVILTAAQTNKDLISQAFRTGALDVLEKPLNHEFLTGKIRELVSREDRALEGTLKMMSLASIIQINCEERNQAQLRLNFQGRSGVIYFYEGEMIHAEANGKTGEEAVYELLSWEDGVFQVKKGAQPSYRTINVPWSGVILEGMRRIDESTAGWSADWEEEAFIEQEEPQETVADRIAKAIGGVKGVNSILIISKDGTLIAQDHISDPESDINKGVYLREEGEIIGGFLEGGRLERVVLTGAGGRVYLQQKNDQLLLMNMHLRSSSEMIFESVETIFKRYQ